ncbi:MAG TPA: hypothetical protein VGD99_11275 [Anaerolineae bacterium]
MILAEYGLTVPGFELNWWTQAHLVRSYLRRKRVESMVHWGVLGEALGGQKVGDKTVNWVESEQLLKRFGLE